MANDLGELGLSCRNFVKDHAQGVEYLRKFGSPMERAIVEKIAQLAGGCK